MMTGINYVINGCSSARTTPGLSLYRSLTLEENTVAVITQEKMIDDNLKRYIKNQNFVFFKIIPTNLNFSIY